MFKTGTCIVDAHEDHAGNTTYFVRTPTGAKQWWQCCGDTGLLTLRGSWALTPHLGMIRMLGLPGPGTSYPARSDTTILSTCMPDDQSDDFTGDQLDED